MAKTKGCSSGCLVAILVVAVAVLVGVGGFWVWHKIQWARADTGDLIGYLAASDAAKRAEAHRRLVDKGDAVVAPLRAALDGGAAGQRTEVVLALLGIGSPRALAATVHALGDPATQVAGAAEAGLLRVGKKAEPALIAGLAEAKPAARATDARLLGETGDKAAAAPLAEALSDTSSGVRLAAVNALGALHNVRAAAPPLAKAMSDRSRIVRVAAANALGALGDARVAAGPLAKALSDKSRAVRVAAASALGSLHSASAAAGPLAKALSDRSSEVRVAAADAIGALRIKSAASKLVSLFGSPNARMRKAAIGALEKLGKAAAAGPVSAALWNRSAKVRAVAAKECGVMRVDGAAPRLASLLKDNNQRVKWAAENALVKLGAAAVAPLSSQLGTGAGSFKWVAAEILVHIARSHPDAVKPLLDLLHHGSVSGVAERYAFFIRLGHKGSEGMLIKALDVYGNATMCVDYLNCGNDKLDRAGRNWAQSHGYSVNTTYGTYGGPTWGSGT